MTHTEGALFQVTLDRRWQLEKAQRVRDRRAALPHPGRDVVVREGEVLDELLVRRRLFERYALSAPLVLCLHPMILFSHLCLHGLLARQFDAELLDEHHRGGRQREREQRAQDPH